MGQLLAFFGLFFLFRTAIGNREVRKFLQIRENPHFDIALFCKKTVSLVDCGSIASKIVERKSPHKYKVMRLSVSSIELFLALEYATSSFAVKSERVTSSFTLLRLTPLHLW